MSWNDPDREDTTIYKVVMNHEEQYSIWPDYKENPLGWSDVGRTGPKAECLAYIKEVWTDMRPLSLRKKMAETAETPPLPPPPAKNIDTGDDLVDRLCDGDHAVEAGLRHEGTVERFKEALDRNYVHIKFTETKGGTELGVRLDRDRCDFSRADFEARAGTAHIEGNLTLDYVKVRCVAEIDLQTMNGKGRLVKVESQP